MWVINSMIKKIKHNRIYLNSENILAFAFSLRRFKPIFTDNFLEIKLVLILQQIKMCKAINKLSKNRKSKSDLFFMTKI